MKITFTYIVVLCLAMLPAKVFSQKYVSPSGNDTNPGTVSQPFKTIQKAASILAAGDTCYIMAGTYRETVTPLSSGTSGSPIVFINYQNDKVFLVGTERVTNWQAYKNGIYKAYVPDTVYQLNVNKSMVNKARYPNFNGDHQSMNGWATVSIDTFGTAFFSGTTFPKNYWKGATVLANTGKKWVSAVGIADSSNANALYCTDKRSFPWKSTPAYAPAVYTGNGKGFITNHLNALDTINEWLWQNDTLYYYPENADMVSSMVVEARIRRLGFDCDSLQFVEIKGINFVWNSISLEGAENCILDSVSVFYPTPFFFFTRSWGRQSYDDQNFGISKWEGKGVSISGNNNVIKNSYVGHSWGDGISIGGQSNKVINCLVEDCDWSATDCSVISTIGNSHELKRNTLRNSGRCITVNRRSRKTNVMYNDMYNCGNLTHDLGITYSYRSNGEGAEIAYNWVHDNHSPTANMGIYLDNHDTAYVVHHNVIWNCTNAIQTNKPAVNNQIYNNTVWSCKKTMGAWGKPGTSVQNQVVRNNLSDKAFNIGNSFSKNLITTSPMFTDPSVYDFTLQPGSPAIDYGMVIPNVTDTFTGKSPDAGAYEYGLVPWIPGTNVTVPDIKEVYLDSVQINLGTEPQREQGMELRIFPNPTKSTIYIQYERPEFLEVSVYDMQGKLILKTQKTSSLDLSSQINGVYLVYAHDIEQNKAFRKKIIISK